MRRRGTLGNLPKVGGPIELHLRISYRSDI